MRECGVEGQRKGSGRAVEGQRKGSGRAVKGQCLTLLFVGLPLGLQHRKEGTISAKKGSENTSERRWKHAAKAVETQGKGGENARQVRWKHTAKAVKTHGKCGGNTRQRRCLWWHGLCAHPGQRFRG